MSKTLDFYRSTFAGRVYVFIKLHSRRSDQVEALNRKENGGEWVTSLSKTDSTLLRHWFLMNTRTSKRICWKKEIIFLCLVWDFDHRLMATSNVFLHRPQHAHFSFSSTTSQMPVIGVKGRVSFIGKGKRCFPVVLSMATTAEAGKSVPPGHGISIMVSDYFPITLKLWDLDWLSFPGKLFGARLHFL